METVTLKKKDVMALAEYFSDRMKELKVAKEDYETFIEWLKNPEKNPNKVQNEDILKNVMLGSEGKENQLRELKILLEDTELQIRIIEPLYNIVKEFAV